VLQTDFSRAEGGAEMSATAFCERRELAHRSSDGIEVTLSWSRPSTRVTVAVLDTRSNEALEFDVDGHFALDAFNHPFAYAPTGNARSTRAHVAAGI
jgi:hypothetical protein